MWVLSRELVRLGLTLSVVSCASPTPFTGFADPIAAQIDAMVAAGTGLVVFDADGTLWRDDVGVDFFRWELSNQQLMEASRLKARDMWVRYERGDLPERDIWAELATCHAGLRETAVASWASGFFRREYERKVFPPMRELIRTLQAAGIDVWVCSASQRWIVEAGARTLRIPSDRVIAVAATVVDGQITDQIVEPVPYRQGKVAAIQEAIGARPDLVFGNSFGDAEMLGIARVAAIVINPSTKFEKHATANGWLVQRFE